MLITKLNQYVIRCCEASGMNLQRITSFIIFYLYILISKKGHHLSSLLGRRLSIDMMIRYRSMREPRCQPTLDHCYSNEYG